MKNLSQSYPLILVFLGLAVTAIQGAMVPNG